MREIKFRGIRKEYDPQWHKSPFQFGHLLNYNAIGAWGNSDYYEYTDVLPETVGQYTWLKDKNGTEIYEGDIYDDDGHKLLVKYGEYEYAFDSECPNEYHVGFYVYRSTPNGYVIQPLDVITRCDMALCIGNIHQNPELLNLPERSGAK